MELIDRDSLNPSDVQLTTVRKSYLILVFVNECYALCCCFAFAVRLPLVAAAHPMGTHRKFSRLKPTIERIIYEIKWSIAANVDQNS